jgi:hypothetical protein
MSMEIKIIIYLLCTKLVQYNHNHMVIYCSISTRTDVLTRIKSYSLINNFYCGLVIKFIVYFSVEK